MRLCALNFNAGTTGTGTAFAWADAYAALASVVDTAKLRGQSVFDTLVALMGHSVLPFLSAQTRE